MYHLSVKIPETLYEKLERISQKKSLKLSDVVRKILEEGVEGGAPKELKKLMVDLLQNGLANYVITTYCLMEEGMQSLVEEGPMLSEKSHAKAEKLIDSFLDKVAKDSAVN